MAWDLERRALGVEDLRVFGLGFGKGTLGAVFFSEEACMGSIFWEEGRVGSLSLCIVGSFNLTNGFEGHAGPESE